MIFLSKGIDRNARKNVSYNFRGDEMLDLQYLLWLQELRLSAGSTLTDFMSFFTSFGMKYSGIIMLFLFWSFHKEAGMLTLFSSSFSTVINGLAKSIVCAYRPWVRDPQIVPPAEVKAGATGYSFPSGHTAKATATFSMWAWLTRKRLYFAIPLLLLTLVIGFTRNFLGVHTPQDVLCGFVIGIISIVIACWLFQWEKQKSGRNWIILLVSAVAMAGYYLFISLKSYPMDYVDGKLLVDPSKMAVDAWKDGGEFLGVLFGWCLEKQFVNFKIPTCWFCKIARFIPGAIILQFGAKPLREFCVRLTEPHIGAFSAYFLLFVFLVFFYPLIFTAIEKRFAKKCS